MQIWWITWTAWAKLHESEVSEVFGTKGQSLFVLDMIVFFAMLTSFCVHECNQKGPKSLQENMCHSMCFPPHLLGENSGPMQFVETKESYEFRITERTKVNQK